MNVLFRFHSSLFLKQPSRAILSLLSLSYFMLPVSGVVLWWPTRWRPSLRIELRRGALRGLFDLHCQGGVALGLLFAVSVASGTYMAWKPQRYMRQRGRTAKSGAAVRIMTSTTTSVVTAGSGANRQRSKKPKGSAP